MVLTFLACFSDPQAPDTDSGDPGGNVGGALRCTLDPALENTPSRVRVAGDGAVWVNDAVGILARYQRDTTADGCVLTGARVPNAEDDFEAVSDISVGADGGVWSLVFFDELRRLGTDGSAEFACTVAAGHTIAAGTNRVWVWGVGDEELHHANIDADSCAAADGVLALERPISPLGRVEDDGLAASAFDAGAEYPGGFVLDLETGALVRELGTGEAGDGAELSSILDLYVLSSGYVAVDGTSLWSIGADGEVIGYVNGYDLLNQSDLVALNSLDYAGDDQYYVATDSELWLVDL